MAAELLSDVTVYRLKEDDFKQSLAKLLLKKVEVRDGEVVATVGV